MEHIYNLSGEQLYKEAMVFKNLADYDNFAIYIIMAANYNHKTAIDTIISSCDFDKQNYSLTINFYQVSSQKLSQNSYSVHCLAYMNCHGLGTEQNYNEATRLYKISMQKGNILSVNNLAQMYQNGRGVKQNYSKAIKLYEIALERNNYVSGVNLAFMYVKGLGVDIDYKKARQLYISAANNGQVSASINLAYMYENGMGCKINYDKAVKLYKIAYDRGSKNSLNYVVRVYSKSFFKDKKQDVIDYFCGINQVEKLKIIYDFDDYTISLIRNKYQIENKNIKLQNQIIQLQRENFKLKTHIENSPDGILYLEAKAE